MQQLRVVLYLLLVFFLFECIGNAQSATSIEWSGYQWSIRSGTGNPGSNTWNPNNVFVDANGYLHLQINNQSGTWSSAELDMITPVTLGFGAFQFHVLGRPDLLDPNTTFGFFVYPPSSVGPDGTNEIDIEFSRSGIANAYNGNYTVYPTSPSLTRSWYGFNMQTPTADESTYRFVWTPSTVSFQSFDGFVDVTYNSNPNASWVFNPADPPSPTEAANYQFYCTPDTAAACISQSPQYFIINLWQYGGEVPASGTTQEVVLTDFKYVPPTAAPVIKINCGVQAEVETTAGTTEVSTIGSGITTKPTVTMTDATPGAVIYYTDSKMASYSTTPPSTSSTEYKEPLGFPEVADTGSPLSTLGSESFSAIAVAPGYTTSAVTSATFAYCVEGPPVAKTFESSAMDLPLQSGMTETPRLQPLGRTLSPAKLAS